MSNDKTLQPVEQKTVLFYEDEITAVRMAGGEVLIPLRPIVEGLGLDWAAQTRRINRDPVLSEVKGVAVTATPGGNQEMLCLPLDYISGFLFGVNANRVKQELRDRVILYQKNCYKVLAEAFTEGRLTADPSFDELLAGDSPAAMAYRMATALQVMARQQLILESRVDEHDKRLEELEAQLGDPERFITPDQAMQLSQAVKTVALKLSKTSGRNEYGGVYGELYRKYGITSYKELPAAKYEDAMSWLNEWRGSIEG
ncbi:MAG: phage antirepressor N-terminal domain-containing protein, partial [Candidatus Promineifilaceae bacterium]